MIRTVKGELVASCEECGEEAYGGTAEFREFVDDLKEDGWRIRKVDGEWSHTCPSCSEA